MNTRACTWLFAAALGCTSASVDPGLEALVRVEGAEYVAGALPKPNGGPEVEQARVPHQRVQIGSLDEHVSGNLAPSATAVLMGMKGDRGHWVLLAGVPSAEEPELPSFEAELTLSRWLSPGPFSLQLSAADARGRVGPRTELALEASDLSEPAALVVRLRWDNAADLDLHVQEPSGELVWARNIHSRGGGLLDLDSNAGCAVQDRAQERVLWRDDYPSGKYQVRIATAGLCAEPVAHWSVDVLERGEELTRATGISLPSDTRSGAGANAGVLALSFELP